MAKLAFVSRITEYSRDFLRQFPQDIEKSRADSPKKKPTCPRKIYRESTEIAEGAENRSGRTLFGSLRAR
jgi:hypothetical protein